MRTLGGLWIRIQLVADALVEQDSVDTSTGNSQIRSESNIRHVSPARTNIVHSPYRGLSLYELKFPSSSSTRISNVVESWLQRKQLQAISSLELESRLGCQLLVSLRALFAFESENRDHRQDTSGISLRRFSSNF